MSSGNEDSYSSNLAEFVSRSIKRWSQDKQRILEPKLKSNFEAVTNADFRAKSWKKGEATNWRSDTWIGFVRVKVWAFYSVMLDLVLKGGKVPFVLLPSKYDETYMSEEMLAERDERIKKMTAKMESQLEATHADREYMMKWLSGGYYGMAFSEFVINEIEDMEFKLSIPPEIEQAVQQGMLDPQEVMQYASYELEKSVEATPGHKYVSVWDMVWDMDTDNFTESAGCAKRWKACPYDLRQLQGPGYIQDAIDRVLAKAKNKKSETADAIAETPGKAAISDRAKNISVYKFFMRAPREHVESFEQMIRSGEFDVIALRDYSEAESTGDDVEIMGEIADQDIIRYVRNESGKRPFKMWVVERNLDESTGTGIADNMASVQSSLIGMLRAFEDNKKLSANVIVAMKKRFFNDPKQASDIKPGSIMDIADSCDDARKAILPIVYPDVGESLISGISLMMQLKDDVSMIPTILQGFSLPKHKPDTAFEIQEMTNNAGKYIGQAIRNNDEMFIEPEMQDIYEYNMLYGDDDECKVNCKVKANGFTSFMNKEVRGARMQQALSLFAANEFLMSEIKLRPHLEVIYESMDEDPDKFLKTDEEKAQDAESGKQAEAEMAQKALELAQAQSKIEADKQIAIDDNKAENEVTVKQAQAQMDVEKADQLHEHRLIEDGIKQKATAADVLKRPKEAQNGK